MKFCSHCGTQIDDQAAFCTKCGCWTTGPRVNSRDASSAGFAVLSFFIPLVGLILFLVWFDSYPKRARSCGKGALIAVIVYIILSPIFLVATGILSDFFIENALQLLNLRMGI